jgi:hypothetical protein
MSPQTTTSVVGEMRPTAVAAAESDVNMASFKVTKSGYFVQGAFKMNMRGLGAPRDGEGPSRRSARESRECEHPRG